MFKKSAVSLLILFASVYQLSGQIYIGNDYKELDSITYAQYINQDWENVLYNGNRALNKT